MFNDTSAYHKQRTICLAMFAASPNGKTFHLVNESQIFGKIILFYLVRALLTCKVYNFLVSDSHLYNMVAHQPHLNHDDNDNDPLHYMKLSEKQSIDTVNNH